MAPDDSFHNLTSSGDQPLAGPSLVSEGDKVECSPLPASEDEKSSHYKQTVDESPYPEPETQNDESIHWSSFADELGLQGLAQEIALNSTLESLQQDYICLNLTSELLELVNSTIEDEIRQAIEIKLGVSLKLELLVQDELEVETPRQFKRRTLQEQRQAAIEAIRQDSTVKKLNDTFGAELIESSVRKINT